MNAGLGRRACFGMVMEGFELPEPKTITSWRTVSRGSYTLDRFLKDKVFTEPAYVMPAITRLVLIPTIFFLELKRITFETWLARVAATLTNSRWQKPFNERIFYLRFPQHLCPRRRRSGPRSLQLPFRCSVGCEMDRERFHPQGQALR